MVKPNIVILKSYFCGVNIDKKYIKRCIELAKNGLGTTYPNPLVGSVIVYNDEIIGEGWHKKAGELHAEVIAINSVKDQSLLSKSTIYVSLEPCSHFGKTPPCCDLIISKNIPKVVIGTIDSNAKVNGGGIQKLKEAGKEVTVGVLEEECNELNKRFFTFQAKKRPYIILKWAESNDGFIAPLAKEKKEPVWISNEYSRQLAHKWRSEEQAILVGTQTVLDDNPKLNVRHWKGKNPIRIVLDRKGKITDDYYVLDNSVTTIILTEKENCTSTNQCIFENVIFDNQLAFRICEILFKYQIQSVLIEGGTKTIQTFIDADLWDEARLFKSKLNLNEGVNAPKIKIGNAKRITIKEDELLILKNHD
jgi:diaminohydroxyphosphoribosylaminopyrimidine deaminase / 5-amino-6-(5-phosphoribosylamino)uracil reductase